MNPNVVTRFAPSPTGYLHGGNYRTAIFAYLFAKKTGGKFIVRIEDTDRERSKKEYEDNIWETIEWLGLQPDEKFRQSEHQARHQEELRRLMESGAAYVSKETPAEAGQRAEVIRFRNPNKAVTFADSIRGPITFDTTDLGDFVIAKSEIEPVFHFAVVVDDADAGVTHVVRGEDHISNTPRQILIQEALGYATPTYAHLPLVLDSDKAKLSKRKGAKALTQYRDEGFLPEAMINYLALLGWHPEGERELFSLEDLTKEFTLERIQKSAAIFDEVKLRWFNHEHLKLLSDVAFSEHLQAFLEARKEPVPTYLSQIAPLLKERAQTLLEAAQALQQGEFSFLETDEVPLAPELLLKGAKAEKDAVGTHLKAVAAMLEGIPAEDFTAEAVKSAIFPYATEQGRSAVLWPLRVALSGREKSPDPFTLAALIGKEKTLKRIAAALSML